ncbi:MAG: hypothetical protein DWQ02_03480 [Bacteroidetes bacterium]|nr:MAG: hypothetical protein DWQ02_03480 [Bacteroidota bacterium]
MKNIIFLSLFAIILFANCQDEVTPPDNNNDLVEATITMPNPMACPTICCSGWFIDIDGVQHHFIDFPEDSDFTSADIENYPVEVLISYEDSDECWEITIVLLEIEAN